MWGSLKQERDYIFIDDIAEAVFLLVAQSNRPNAIFNIGQSESHTLEEVLALVSEITGHQHNYRIVENHYNGIRRSLLDCSSINQKVGWKPSVSLGLGIELAWKRKAGTLREKPVLRNGFLDAFGPGSSNSCGTMRNTLFSASFRTV